jgi:hypothetical protein
MVADVKMTDFWDKEEIKLYVLMAVSTKMVVFWVVAPCGPV